MIADLVQIFHAMLERCKAEPASGRTTRLIQKLFGSGKLDGKAKHTNKDLLTRVSFDLPLSENSQSIGPGPIDHVSAQVFTSIGCNLGRAYEESIYMNWLGSGVIGGAAGNVVRAPSTRPYPARCTH